MADVKKVTETIILETIAAIVKGEALPYDNVYVEDVTDWVEKKLEQKAAKAEKAKEVRAAKRAEGDELQARVQELMTNELQTAQDITDMINDPEITKAKVQYRINQLVAAGAVTKEVIKVEKDKRTAYRLA